MYNNDPGTEAEALSDWLEGEDEYTPRRGRRAPKFRAHVVTGQREGTHYYPKTDAEAIAQIEKLGVYQWDTHKVSGAFSHDPYWITATIADRLHTIHLPGRFGRTLTYLKEKTS